MSQTYPFELKPLPYNYDALEPYIHELTVQIHHDRHQQTYVNNLNAALKNAPEYQNCTLEELLKMPEQIDVEIRTAVLRNAGGVYNHQNYFDGMTPGAKAEPEGNLDASIREYFGSFEKFKKEFSDAAAGVFGSGYALLIATTQGWLQIITLANQDTPVPFNYTPLLTLDVWEHAYYLDYQNLRADYIKQWWNVVNWKAAEELYDVIAQRNKKFSFDDMPE